MILHCSRFRLPNERFSGTAFVCISGGKKCGAILRSMTISRNKLDLPLFRGPTF